MALIVVLKLIANLFIYALYFISIIANVSVLFQTGDNIWCNMRALYYGEDHECQCCGYKEYEHEEEEEVDEDKTKDTDN